MHCPPGMFSLVTVSGNGKTGPIPVSTSPATTCPAACPLKNNGCYADGGHLGIHWRKVTNEERGVPYPIFIEQVKGLPYQQLWRHNQAGDLVKIGELIDALALEMLVEANLGKRGFTYTHHTMGVQHNRELVAWACRNGLVINLSADSIAEADHLMALEIAPVVTILPMDAPRLTISPDGHHVLACPAEDSDITCARCGLCALPLAKRRRKTAQGWRYLIIGFRAHGNRRMRVHQIALERD